MGYFDNQSVGWTIVCIVSVLILAYNLSLEVRRDLMMLQQNSYRYERYMKWLRTSADTTSVVRILFYACVLAQLSDNAMIRFAGIGGATLLALYNIKNLSCRHYKKPLVWTNRVRRLYVTVVLLVVLIFVASVLLSNFFLFTLIFTLSIAYAASHILIVVSLWILRPIEAAINRQYYNDAARILSSMPNLKVIGITGSYGKTSTKHYLERILTEQFNVVITPGSYNTLLGVIRTIRERMQPYTEVFVCEMGAKNIGDIKEICDLVHPSIGIITAVGEQHLESFKTIENVQRTKFELADSIPSDGVVYVNADFPYAANRETDNCRVVKYAMNGDIEADLYVKNVVSTRDGSRFVLVASDGEYELYTRLLGEFNISNLIPAIAVARSLGMSMDVIARAVGDIRPVEHRLSVKKTPGGITILDDAFNSNPKGSSMALDVLSQMTDGRRIVITPGMIELGEKQKELNQQFGKHIAECADYAIVVGKYNREAIIAGINDAAILPTEHVFTPDTFSQAQSIMLQIAQSGDTVLYENDLPDTFK